MLRGHRMSPVKATKWCPSCKAYIEIDGWWGNVRRFDGLQASCKDCQRAEMKTRRKRTTKKYLAKVNPLKGLKGDAGRKALKDFVSGADDVLPVDDEAQELLAKFLNGEDL